MDKKKKPLYKKWWVWLIAVLIFARIGFLLDGEEESKEEPKKVETSAPKVEKESEADLKEKEDAEIRAEIDKMIEEQLAKNEELNTVEKTKPEIDTSFFEYASNVDVTDALDINDHITLMIDMKTENQGLAFQHVLNQTYDFLQQPSVEGAKTIGINVIVKGDKVGMFTVYPEKFKQNDEEPMSDAVLEASEIEFMTNDVKEFGKAMDSW